MPAADDIIFDVKSDSNEEFGHLIIFNIHPSAPVKQLLYSTFNLPTGITDITCDVSGFDWPVTINAEIRTKAVDANTKLVLAKLELNTHPYTFTGKETLTFGISGKQPGGLKQYEKTVRLAADKIPNAGTVGVKCAAAPDPALVGCQQELSFDGLFFQAFVTPGKNAQIQLPPGTYGVAAPELTNKDQTVIAPAIVSTNTVNVLTDKVTALSVTYGPVQKPRTVDVTIDSIASIPVKRFHVTVSILETKSKFTDFWAFANATTPVFRLPSSGTIRVSIDPVIMNNVQYSFSPKDITAPTPHQSVTFTQFDKKEPVDTSHFPKLSVVVTTKSDFDTAFSLRLVSPDNIVYIEQVKAKSGTTTFLVAQANYVVEATGFIHDSTVYVVEGPATLNVTGNTQLPLNIIRGANLKVPGFPNFLGFGGITSLVLDAQNKYVDIPDFKEARASSIFKYAGFDGAGDAKKYLTPKEDGSTPGTIKLAHAVGQELHQSVLPVLVSYTCNLSGGGPYDVPTRLANTTGLAHSFGNLILSLKLAGETITNNPMPHVGYIVNPDFISMCQQAKLPPSYKVIVRKPLADALQHWGIQVSVPDSIQDTLRGYVLAVNWLVTTIAKRFKVPITWGWQINIWGNGSALWVYSDKDPAAEAQTVAQYINDLGVFDKTYPSNFLAIDRYEADDFTPRAGAFRFGPHEWPRFFEFCKALSVKLQFPLVAWQIPASRTPLIHDHISDDIGSQHWGTGGSYVLGDPGLGSNYHNINPKLLGLKINAPKQGDTVEDMFKRDEQFDWTNPAYVNFPLFGIAAVLLGGGETVGIATSVPQSGDTNPGEQKWVRAKLHAYMEHPIPLDHSSSSANIN